jgi:hypothetical protein
VRLVKNEILKALQSCGIFAIHSAQMTPFFGNRQTVKPETVSLIGFTL